MVHNSIIPTWLCRALSIVVLLAALPVYGVDIQNPFDVHLLPKEFVAGTSSLVSWIPTAEGTVSLKLFAGVSRDMRYVSTIAHFIDNTGSFTWTPSLALDAGNDYALMIVSDADDQLIDCSPPFSIKRPLNNRQIIYSSYMSDFGQSTAGATTQTRTTNGVVAPATIAPTAAASTVIAPNSASNTSPTNAQTTVTETSVQTNPTSQASSSSGLSTGAAIGIGVGATLLVLLLIALLVFYLLRRRRRQKKLQQPPAPEYTPPSGPAELETGKSGVQNAKAVGADGGGGGEAGRKSELDGGIAQLPMAKLGAPAPLGPEEYAELERRRRAVELQGQSMDRGAMRPAAELQGHAHPRAELEALRANSRYLPELGGQAILTKVQPMYHR